MAIAFGRPVRRDDDLLAAVVEGVERVEELLLRLLAPLERLDVVDEEDVRRAVAVLERADAPVAQGVDELVGERLHRDVGQRQLRVVRGHEVADRVEQVRLAQAHAAVDEEGVVGARRRLGHGEGGRVGEAVRRPGHEGLEGEARLQPLQRRGGRAVERPRGRRRPARRSGASASRGGAARRATT